MKKYLALVAVAVLGVGLSVANIGDQDNVGSTELSEEDVEFLNSMIAHHESAIEMAELVDEHTEREELLDLSEEVMVVQKQEIKYMENLLEEEEVDQQDMMMHQMHIEYLEDLEGGEFDLAFLSFMGSHHYESLIESQQIIDQGSSEEVKTFAEEIVETQEEEIRQMYVWYLEWS